MRAEKRGASDIHLLDLQIPNIGTHGFDSADVDLLIRLLLPVQVEVVDPLKVGCHLLVVHRLPYALHQLVSCTNTRCY